MAKKRIDWCVLDYAREPTALVCNRCNASQPITLPMTIDKLCVDTSKFMKEHEYCPAPT